ncbi:hypothetical protein TRAPUB_9531 [Trametes pubescens]|uniref:Uncharacterized protein n=1 Tax=Trametes pubescens TaxID=154538 RepID=A0A1M2W292_TRAPU|nr:hypothetical protein TRAPUB_9531 [Trametes pubescens]
MPHFTLPRTHSSPAKPPPPTPGASGPAPASPPKGVKRIVSGLKRRISHTFLRGHRHHASTDALDVSHSSLDDHEPLLSLCDQPTPISISVSPHHGPSVDTLTRGVADGGLGKHVADCSDSSDATSDYSAASSFRGRGHRTASSCSGSFSYTSPGGLQDVTGDAAPLPEIAESPSSPEQTEAPAPPESSDSAALDIPATVDALALALSTPLPEDTESELGAEVEAEAETASAMSLELPAVDSVEDKRSIESLYSRLSPEYVGAPFPEEVSSEFTRERTFSLASVESLTAPLETLVLSEDVSPSAAPVDSQSDAASTHLPLPVSTSADVPLPSAELDVLEEPRQRKISMLSIESLTAPVEILVLPDDATSPRTSPDTEPETSPFDVSLSIPLPPSTPDSPSILPVESQQLPAPEDEFSSILGPQPTETAELPSAQSPAGPTAPAGGDDAPVSFSWVLEYFPTESAPSEPEESAQDELDVALGDAVLPVVERSSIPSEPLHIAPLPSSPDPTHSAPPTPPLAASDEYGSESEEDEDFEFDPHGLTMAMPMLFLPSPKVRYPAFSSLTWWLPRGMV